MLIRGEMFLQPLDLAFYLLCYPDLRRPLLLKYFFPHPGLAFVFFFPFDSNSFFLHASRVLAVRVTKRTKQIDPCFQFQHKNLIRRSSS